MRKNYRKGVCWLFAAVILLLLITGCQNSPSTRLSVEEYDDSLGGEQPSVRDAGLITADDLKPLSLADEYGEVPDLSSKKISMTAVSDTAIWMRDQESTLYCAPSGGGALVEAGKTAFAVTYDYYAYASDGNLWWTYADEEEYGYLVKLDYTHRKEIVVKRWANTTGFMKAVEKDGIVYINRIEIPSKNLRYYIVEGYNVQTEESVVLLKEKVTVAEDWNNNVGTFFYAMTVANDSIYVLASEAGAPQETKFSIKVYTLTGELKATFLLGSAYMDLVGSMYSSPKNIEVIGDVVAIEGLQSRVLLYRLRPEGVQRIYLTEARSDILNGTKGTLMQVREPSSADKNYLVFCVAGERTGSDYYIVYDGDNDEFVSFRKDMGDTFIVAITASTDMLFRENLSDENSSGYNCHLYRYNLKEFLQK